ncbi:MAG: winged helix-turn-helix transcriptional regulator [Bacteroidia bacterium]
MNEFQPQKFLGYLMAHAMKGVIGRLLERFSEAGYPISRHQWLIMAKSYHFENKKILQSDVVDMMLGDKTQVTRAVEDLVKKGWIIQEIDREDRRNRVLKITEKGKEIVPELMVCVEQTITETTRNISEKDMETAKSVLAKIIENSQELNQNES